MRLLILIIDWDTFSASSQRNSNIGFYDRKRKEGKGRPESQRKYINCMILLSILLKRHNTSMG